MKLYKGNVIVVGRKSNVSLYDKIIASFEDDKGLYNQADAGACSCRGRGCVVRQNIYVFRPGKVPHGPEQLKRE